MATINPADLLRLIRAFISDLDATLVAGNRPQPGLLLYWPIRSSQPRLPLRSIGARSFPRMGSTPFQTAISGDRLDTD
ncbi:MAG: hypothetical protein ACUVR4_11950 [Anaerolineae bacterium]